MVFLVSNLHKCPVINKVQHEEGGYVRKATVESSMRFGVRCSR